MREIPSDYINPPLPPRPPPSPLSHQPKSNLPMLYYGLVVVGTAAIVLAIYNLIIVKWCTRRQSQQPPRRPNGRLIEATASQSSGNECPVCLSIFEEGEEVRQLPGCKHSFHAPCIDMWLYSHFDCPLCRAPVDVPRWQRDMVMDSQENSRVNLLDSGNSTAT